MQIRKLGQNEYYSNRKAYENKKKESLSAAIKIRDLVDVVYEM